MSDLAKWSPEHDSAALLYASRCAAALRSGLSLDERARDERELGELREATGRGHEQLVRRAMLLVLGQR
jgi:hypothetical protein